MTKPALTVLLLLATAACGGAGGAAPASGPAAGSYVTVRVENTSQDMLRVTGPGTSGARIQAGRSACVRVNATRSKSQLTAVPVGARTTVESVTESPTGDASSSAGNSSRGAGSPDAVRSPEFVPGDAPAWLWRVGSGATGNNDFRPTDVPCT